MKRGYLGRPAAFTLILAHFVSFLIQIDGFEILNLEVDETDPQQGHHSLLTEEILIEFDKESKVQTCSDFSFKYPLKCMKNGCKWNPATRECRHEPSSVKGRVKRDAKSKCFHFDASPRICGYNGCKYDVKKRKCLKMDGSEDPEATETPKPTKLEEKSKKDGTKYWRFMESPTPTYCTRYHGKPHACGFEGCSFDKWSHRCGVGSSKGQGRSMGSAEEGEEDGSGEESEEKGVEVEESVGSKGRSLSGALSCGKFNKDKEGCVASRVNCLFNETSEECIEAKEPSAGGDGSKKYCDFLYGKKNNCEKAGCSHDKKNKKCSSGKGESSDELDTVSVTYIVMQPKTKKRGAEECSELDGCPRGCLFAGCKYNEETNKCTERESGVISIGTDLSAADMASKYLTEEECSKINGTDRPCKNAGCNYEESSKTCKTAMRIPSSDKCESSAEEPVKCIEDDCLYDNKHKTCFENDFQEFTYTITYVRVTSISKRLVAKQCSELDACSKSCKIAGCKYDESAKKCLEIPEGEGDDSGAGSSNTTLTNDECIKFSSKLRACGYAGCRYKTKGQKCIVISDKMGCGSLDGDQEACDEAGCVYDKTQHICKDKTPGDDVTTIPATNVTKTSTKGIGRSLDGDADGGDSGEGGGDSGEGGDGDDGGEKGEKGEEGDDGDDGGEKGGKGEGSSSEESSGDHSHSDTHCNKSNGKKKDCIAAGCRYANKICSPKNGHTSHEGGSGEHQDCSMHDEEPVQCADAGCSYNEEEETCSRKDKEVKSENTCAQHNGKRRACIKAGCKFNKDKGTCCGDQDSSSTEETETTIVTKTKRTKKTRLSRAECKKMDGNKKECKAAGCSFKSGKCHKGKGKGRAYGDDEGDSAHMGRSLGGLHEGLSSEERDDCSKHNGNYEACEGTENCFFDKQTENCVIGTKPPGPPTNEQCSELQGSPRVCKHAGCQYDDDSGKCWMDKKEPNEQTGTCCNEMSNKKGYAGLFYLFPISGSQGKDDWAQKMKEKVNNVIDAINS